MFLWIDLPANLPLFLGTVLLSLLNATLLENYTNLWDISYGLKGQLADFDYSSGPALQNNVLPASRNLLAFAFTSSSVGHRATAGAILSLVDASRLQASDPCLASQMQPAIRCLRDGHHPGPGDLRASGSSPNRSQDPGHPHRHPAGRLSLVHAGQMSD